MPFRACLFTLTYSYFRQKGTNYCAEEIRGNMTEVRLGQYIAPTAVDTGTEGIK